MPSLIFDFDGTLGNSAEANTLAANVCLKALGFPEVSKATVRMQLGKRAINYYQGLLPRSAASQWKQLKHAIETVIPTYFERYLRLYPEVKETLTELRKRGFTLILYSNATPPYFNAVLKATGLKPYFDHTQPLEPHATKTSTIRKLLPRFPQPATVVGDRDHDLVAAKENRLESIHCAYGFQPHTKLTPTTTIKKFGDLLKIFA